MARLVRVLLPLWVIAFAAQAAGRPKLVVTGLSGSDAAMQRVGETLSDSLLTELARSKRVDAVGPGDLSAVLGLERQKQLLGCGTDSASCLAEISAALGAPWVLTGSVMRMGKTTRIDLKLIHTSDGRVAWRDGRTMKDESEFFDAIAEMVKELVMTPELDPTPERAPAGLVSSAPASTPRVAPWLLVGAGGAALVVGGVFSGLAGSEWNNLHSDPWRATTPWEGIRDETAAFNRNIILGPVLLGAGVAAAASGLIWALAGQGKPPPLVTLGPTTNGVVLGGAF